MKIAIGILRSGGRVLIAQRLPKREYGKLWEFPGGKVEPGEDTITALSRELNEEIGIIVRSAEHLVDLPFPADENVTLSFHVVDWFDGTPTLQDHLGLVWVEPEEIRGFDIINTPMLTVLDYLHSYDVAARERGKRAMES